MTEVRQTDGKMILRISFYFQTDIMTRAELAFGALDRNKKGFITAKEGQWEEGKIRRRYGVYSRYCGDF